MLDDKTIDAVLIATPQHLHALHFVAAIQAGKDVYQEKTMAFNPGHARRMRNALEGSGRVVQVGMQMNSGTGIRRCASWPRRSAMGTSRSSRPTTSAIAPYGGWIRRFPPTATPSTSIGPPSRARRGSSLRSPALHQLAVLLGLLGRQRLREHGPHGRLLVRGAGPVDPAPRDHDRCQLPLAQDAGSRHLPGLDAASRRSSSSRSPRCSATTTMGRGTTSCSAPRRR